MNHRPSTAVFSLIALGAAVFALTVVDAARLERERAPGLMETARLAGTLALTDLALFSEARYTRHPTQADLHSAFQDHPLAFEHFPAGSLVKPRLHGIVDRKAAQPD